MKNIKNSNKFRKLYKGDYLFEYGDKKETDEDKDLIVLDDR